MRTFVGTSRNRKLAKYSARPKWLLFVAVGPACMYAEADDITFSASIVFGASPPPSGNDSPVKVPARRALGRWEETAYFPFGCRG